MTEDSFVPQPAGSASVGPTICTSVNVPGDVSTVGMELSVVPKMPWQPDIPKASHVGNVQLQRHQEVWIDARNDVVCEPPGWRSKLRHRDQWLSQEKNKGCPGPVDPGEATEPQNPKDI